VRLMSGVGFFGWRVSHSRPRHLAMNNDTPFDPQLLDRYLAGELVGDERGRVESWLRLDSAAAALVRDHPQALLGDATRTDTDAAWASLAQRIVASGHQDQVALQRARNTERSATTVRGNRTWMRGFSKIAAVFIVVFGGALVWRGSQRTGGSLTAPRGREMSATLPDGTRLTLAAGSTATWSSSFGNTTRDVMLSGQALFDVVHDAAHPFRVHARDAVAEDVGTRFVVRAWPEMSAVEVAVEEGVVALTDSLQARAGRGTAISAGQRGHIAPDGQVLVTADAEASLAWAHGELAFDNRPLSEVLPEIGRRFDVEIRADSAIASRRLSARFAAQSLSDVLGALAMSLNVRVLGTGPIYTLVPSTR
jgi:transmembrane sensor